MKNPDSFAAFHVRPLYFTPHSFHPDQPYPRNLFSYLAGNWSQANQSASGERFPQLAIVFFSAGRISFFRWPVFLSNDGLYAVFPFTVDRFSLRAQISRLETAFPYLGCDDGGLDWDLFRGSDSNEERGKVQKGRHWVMVELF